MVLSKLSLRLKVPAVIIAGLFLVFVSYQGIKAMEMVRQKNLPTVFVFPILDDSGDPLSSVGTTDTEVDTFADGTNPDGFADLGNEVTEIGTTGVYYLALTTAEMNYDYMIIRVVCSTTEAKTQHILVRTTVGDPANAAVTDDGGAINVNSGVVEANVEQIADDAVTDGGDGVLDVNIVEVGDDDITDNADGRLEVNVEEIADAAVDTASAQLGVNVVFYAGTTAESTVSGQPDVNVVSWEDDAVPATADGYPAVNVDEWDDTDVATAVAGKPEVNVTHWEDSAITDANADPDVDVVSMGNNVITSASINDGAITDADVANDVQVDVLTIETGDATDALDKALTDVNLDHLMKTAVANNADMTAEVADGTVLSNIMSSGSDTSTYVVADDSLQGISEGAAGGGATAAEVWGYGTRELTSNTNLNDPTAATIADAVWDEVIVGAHDTAESAGALLDTPGDWATATGFSTHAAADVWTVGTRELTHLDEDTTTIDLDATTIGTVENANITSLANNVITAASINDGAITDAKVANDVQVDVLTIETGDASDALDTACDTVTVTSMGADTVTAAAIAADAIGSSELATGAIGAAEIDADAIGSSEIAAGAIGASEIDADAITASEIADGAIDDAALAADVDTLVNDEVKDVLTTDTFAEPGQENPAATQTLQKMLQYLYKYWRNKIVTSANTIEIYNDAGDTVDQKAAISDDGTDFTRGEIETGP